jgi:hypothetical protein
MKSRSVARAFLAAAAVLAAAGPARAEGEFGPRLAAYYLATPGVAGDLRNPGTGHSVGLELSNAFARYGRYRFAFGFQGVDLATGIANASVNGIRLEPFGIGPTIPIIATEAIRIAIEGNVNLLYAETFLNTLGTGNALIRMGTGGDIGAVAAFGPFMAGVYPFGVDVQWLQWAPATGVTQTDAAVNWRIRVAAGFSF